jgi:curli biogenesis system outer membrane secretion channel CsgG
MSKLILKAIPTNATSASAEQTLGFIDTTGSTQRVSVKAQPKTVYRLVDAKTGEVIQKQTVVRKGKKLQVMVDNLNVVEVDDFFPDEASNANVEANMATYNLAGTQVAYTTKAITGLSISDVDAGTGTMSFTLSVTTRLLPSING